MRKRFFKKPNQSTSWEKSSQWYNKLVGTAGHYYHQHVVLPGVVRLLELTKQSSVLDVGCGQGILGRQLPSGVYYQGIDSSFSLIKAAQAPDKAQDHFYTVADATKNFPFSKKDFTHAAIIFALQNMEHPELALKNVSQHLKPGGRLIIVLNHPCFRIPRQSGWTIDASAQGGFASGGKTKQPQRWITRYLSPLKIPIHMHPGKARGLPAGRQETTWTFHQPLSAYSRMLKASGFVIENLEEWVTNKKSTNKLENQSAAEIPLFLTIVAKKTNLAAFQRTLRGPTLKGRRLGMNSLIHIDFE